MTIHWDKKKLTYKFDLKFSEVLRMKNKSVMSERRSHDKCSSNIGALSGDKHNRCAIVPTKVNMIAEAIERKQNHWFVRTKVASDLVVQIGDKSCFDLHILPMVSRSAYLNRTIFKQKSTRGSTSNTSINIRLDNFPGGEEIFELIVKFCYGWKIDLNPKNAAPLYCAASFLEMSEDLETDNLIVKTESFLTFTILSSWKDTFLVLKTCESISSFARDLLIQRRCSEAIAWKICIDPKSFIFMLENDIGNPFSKRVSEDWWFEDVSTLRIDHFIEVVSSIKQKGIKAEVLGSCIAYWTSKWLSRISIGNRIPTQKGVNIQVRKVIVESLIRVLPNEENSVCLNFLLHLLKVGSMMKIDEGLSLKLEKRAALCLEKSQPLDLLVKNYGESKTLYDVGIVARVVEAYARFDSRDHDTKIFVVGRLVDGYLALVASDENLPPRDFRLLLELLPKNDRYSEDHLYRRIDRYLKAHPKMREEERKVTSRGIEYHKLSKEAREHAMKNDRLPLNITTQFILLEQVNIVKSMVDSGSSFIRTDEQMIINVKSESRKECMEVQNQMEIMRKEVENMKVCRVEIKKLAKKL